jgi:hypothetical protein
MNTSISAVLSFLIGLTLAIALLWSINYRNCIVLSSNVSRELLNKKLYNAESDKCYRVVKKSEE